MKNYLLLGCSLSLLLLAACTDSGKCTRGEIACQCTADKTCAKGARCVEGTCISDSKPVVDASSGTEPDSGPEKPIDCTVATFKGACKELCRAVCKTEDNLCVDSSCDADYCTDKGLAASGGLLKNCEAECVDDVACVQDLCKQELKRECEDFWYPDPDTSTRLAGCFNEDPKCVLDPDFGCSDTCGSVGGVGGDLVNNGRCEDGGEGSVTPQLCPRTTDCTDCGSRTCGKQGASCENGGDCCGFFNDKAYCVDIDRDPNVKDPRCLATCTTSQDCEDGLACIGIKDNTVSVCSP